MFLTLHNIGIIKSDTGPQIRFMHFIGEEFRNHMITLLEVASAFHLLDITVHSKDSCGDFHRMIKWDSQPQILFGNVVAQNQKWRTCKLRWEGCEAHIRVVR